MEVMFCLMWEMEFGKRMKKNLNSNISEYIVLQKREYLVRFLHKSQSKILLKENRTHSITFFPPEFESAHFPPPEHSSHKMAALCTEVFWNHKFCSFPKKRRQLLARTRGLSAGCLCMEPNWPSPEQLQKWSCFHAVPEPTFLTI